MDATWDDLTFVEYRKRGPVAVITMNRPQALNAMNSGMHEELQRIWADFEADPEILVGVLTGAGERAFSVGQDLNLDAPMSRLAGSE